MADHPQNEIHISNDKKMLDIDFIHQYLSTQSYWAKGRDKKIVESSIENSLCFGVYRNSNQIGFARVVTDYAVFAWIMDVFIIDKFKGKGYGKQLMKTIMNHDQLKIPQRWGLATEDAHGLYKKFGFKQLKNPQYMMELTREENAENV